MLPPQPFPPPLFPDDLLTLAHTCSHLLTLASGPHMWHECRETSRSRAVWLDGKARQVEVVPQRFQGGLGVRA
eukprot:366341-Chlamydomonas_euryale.AAC.22